MRIELVAYTQQNPALSPATLADVGDLATIWNGKASYPENMVEYAGRVCYRSTHRMGTAGDFIADRVREGHEDIIEHVVITVQVSDSEEPLRWRMKNRHCEVSELGGGEWLVSGNTRVWLDFFRHGIALEAIPLCKAVAPGIFAGVAGAADLAALAAIPAPATVDPAPLLPTQDGPMRVTLLGYTVPQFDDIALAKDHGSATFFFEGISRTCTHQLVRHRLASFSMESQRYVELNKGAWDAVVPPAVAAKPEALAEYETFWDLAEEKYNRLRALGIRKEDARFLLPNAAETRIITTMNFAAWQHFFWLRALDKAAQWEIRLMGQRALAMMAAVAPGAFEKESAFLREKFGG